MNVREPDWAFVARSLIKVLAVTVAIFLAFGAVERVLLLFVDVDDGRTARVYGTAARIANPDKRLLPDYPKSDGLLETTLTLWGEPRLAGPSQGRVRYEIANRFGTMRAPSLGGPSGSLANAIDSVEAEAATATVSSRQLARKTIDELPQGLVAVAVVEFADAMTAERLVAFNRRHRICGGENVSYMYRPSYYDDSSEPASLNAVVWNRDMSKEDIWLDLTYQCETEPEAALAEFRRWVGLLDEGEALGEFELGYYWLAGAAEEGVVYGLVVDRWKLSDLRKLLDDAEVRTVHLADVAFDLGESR